MAHTYSHLYNLRTTGLRFFTVYGPWGRPDMAPYIFVKRILEEKPITVFNDGNMWRDFTYVSDIVQGVFKVIDKKEVNSNYQILNIGNSNAILLKDFILTVEEIIGKKADIEYKSIRDGDVLKTYSDSSLLVENYKYKPTVNLYEGMKSFINWYKTNYNA